MLNELSFLNKLNLLFVLKTIEHFYDDDFSIFFLLQNHNIELIYS